MNGCRLVREGGKDILRDFLGEMSVTDHPARGRVDHPDVPFHEFLECVLLAVSQIALQQFMVVHSTVLIEVPAGAQNRPNRY